MMTLSALMSTCPGADLGMKALAPAMMVSCMILGSPTADTTTMGVAGAARFKACRQDSPTAPGRFKSSNTRSNARGPDTALSTSSCEAASVMSAPGQACGTTARNASQ